MLIDGLIDCCRISYSGLAGVNGLAVISMHGYARICLVQRIRVPKRMIS